MSIFVAILLCLYAPPLESREINVDVEKYCKMQCPIPGTVHTICEFKCEIAPGCENFQEYELNEKERTLIVQHHNEFRNRLASGNDTRGGNTNAKDMLELQYDPEIEVAVSCWGRRCLFAHDKCRQTVSYDTAGQNLFIQSSSLPMNAKDESYLYDCVKSWYEEIVNVNPQYTRQFTLPSKGQIGHFTQVVWSTTAFVGCTRVSWTSQVGLKYKLHIICNYSPAGNIFGASVYTKGVGCSEGLARSTLYSSLCVKKGQKPLLTNTTASSIAGPLESSTISGGTSGNASSSEMEVIPSKLPTAQSHLSKTSTTSLHSSLRPVTTKGTKGTKTTKVTKGTKATKTTKGTKATKATKTTTKIKPTTTTTKPTTITTAITTTTTTTTTLPTTTTTTTTTASTLITPLFVFTVKPQKPPPLSAIITTYHPTFPLKVQPPPPQPPTPSPTSSASPTTQPQPPPPPPENDAGANGSTGHKNAERKLITVSPVTKLKTRATSDVKCNMRNSNISILLINFFVCTLLKKNDVV